MTRTFHYLETESHHSCLLKKKTPTLFRTLGERNYRYKSALRQINTLVICTCKLQSTVESWNMKYIIRLPRFCTWFAEVFALLNISWLRGAQLKYFKVLVVKSGFVNYYVNCFWSLQELERYRKLAMRKVRDASRGTGAEKHSRWNTALSSWCQTTRRYFITALEDCVCYDELLVFIKYLC